LYIKLRLIYYWGIIPNRIIEKQSTKVDSVSGATLSSVAIMNAVEDAVKKAQ
jgi:fumarate reductase flavoprotein subunit